MTIPNDIPYDIDAPGLEDLYLQEIKEEERLTQAAHDAIRWLARNALENNPSEHRTGFVTAILKTAANVLVNERGWSRHEAADALVLEAVRASGNLLSKRGGRT